MAKIEEVKVRFLEDVHSALADLAKANGISISRQAERLIIENLIQRELGEGQLEELPAESARRVPITEKVSFTEGYEEPSFQIHGADDSRVIFKEKK